MCPESKNSNRKILEPQSLIHVDFHFELFLHFFLFLKAIPELLHLDIFKLLLVEVLFQHLSVILYYRNHILFHVLWLEAANYTPILYYTISPGRVRCSALQSQSHMLTFLLSLWIGQKTGSLLPLPIAPQGGSVIFFITLFFIIIFFITFFF